MTKLSDSAGAAISVAFVPLSALGVMGAIKLHYATFGKPSLQLLVAFGYVAIDVTVMLLCAAWARQTNRPKWPGATFFCFSITYTVFGLVWFVFTAIDPAINCIIVVLLLFTISWSTFLFQYYLLCKFANLVDTASEAMTESDSIETELGLDIKMAPNADNRELDSSNAGTNETDLDLDAAEMALNEGIEMAA